VLRRSSPTATDRRYFPNGIEYQPHASPQARANIYPAFLFPLRFLCCLLFKLPMSQLVIGPHLRSHVYPHHQKPCPKLFLYAWFPRTTAQGPPGPTVGLPFLNTVWCLDSAADAALGKLCTSAMTLENLFRSPLRSLRCLLFKSPITHPGFNAPISNVKFSIPNQSSSPSSHMSATQPQFALKFFHFSTGGGQRMSTPLRFNPAMNLRISSSYLGRSSQFDIRTSNIELSFPPGGTFF
jgi:hypothetical protein